MERFRLAAVAVAGAALIFSLNSKTFAVLAIGEGAEALNVPARGQAEADLERRLGRAEQRLESLSRQLDRSQRDLRAARAALIIARFELVEDDLTIAPELGEVDTLQQPQIGVPQR